MLHYQSWQATSHTEPAVPGFIGEFTMQNNKQLQPGQKVSVWGRFDKEEAPEVLSVKANGVWVSRSERDMLGRIKITKQRVPLHAVSPV